MDKAVRRTVKSLKVLKEPANINWKELIKLFFSYIFNLIHLIHHKYQIHSEDTDIIKVLDMPFLTGVINNSQVYWLARYVNELLLDT